MKFSLLLINIPDAGYPPERLLREDLEQVRVARDAGFDGIVVGHHVLAHPYQFPDPLSLLARLCAEAPGMHFATGIFLLPLYHPISVAEEIATLDVACGGKFRFGVGLGYRSKEFDLFGLSSRDRVGRYTESIEIIRRLWTNESVTYTGRHFRVEGVRTALRPAQKPRVPFWFGADADVAVQRAVRLADTTVGDTWYVPSGTPLRTLEAQMAFYRSALAELGKPFPAEFPMRRNLYVAADRATAFREVRPGIERIYASFTEWGLPGTQLEGRRADTFEERVKDTFVIGSPEDCTEELRRFHERTGANHFVLRIQWPSLTQTQVLKAIEMCGQKVFPLVRQIEVAPKN